MKMGASSRLGGSHSATVEDYLKAVHAISQRSQNGLASTGDIARELWLSPGTVSLMVQRLTDAGLLKHQPHYGCWLTNEGLDIAKRVLQRPLNNFLQTSWGWMLCNLTRRRTS
jgi:Mn-dependent DtxR family transcriptional regulator